MCLANSSPFIQTALVTHPSHPSQVLMDDIGKFSLRPQGRACKIRKGPTSIQTEENASVHSPIQAPSMIKYAVFSQTILVFVVLRAGKLVVA